MKRPACGEPAGLKSALEVQVFLADGELVALCDSYYAAGLAQRTRIAQDAGSGGRCAR